jgi:transposase-like protein
MYLYDAVSHSLIWLSKWFENTILNTKIPSEIRIQTYNWNHDVSRRLLKHRVVKMGMR